MDYDPVHTSNALEMASIPYSFHNIKTHIDDILSAHSSRLKFTIHTLVSAISSKYQRAERVILHLLCNLGSKNHFNPVQSVFSSPGQHCMYVI